MTAGTVVITGGILATVILLCIIAVLCYCRLQVQGGAGGGATAGCRYGGGGATGGRCYRGLQVPGTGLW